MDKKSTQDIDPADLCQIEIPITNSEKSLLFYENVFGWKKSLAEIHSYHILDIPAHLPFGISLLVQNSKNNENSESSIRTLPTLFFNLPPHIEIEHARELIEKYGGKNLKQERKLPGYGQSILFEDPDGNRLGLFKKALQ